MHSRPFRLFINRTAIMLLSALFCLPVSASKNYPVRDRLTDFSIKFAEDVLHSTSDAKKLYGLKRKDVSDSTAYDTMRLFGRGMFVRSQQTIAFEYFKQALSILSEYDEISKDCMTFKANCYLLLGSATEETGMQQLALEYFFKGLKISEKLGNHPLSAFFYNNIGVCYTHTNNYEKAEEYFSKALKITLDAGLKEHSSLHYRNLSEIRLKASDFDGAIGYALKAAQCLDEKKFPDEYYVVQSHLGMLYLQKADFDKASIWLGNAYTHQSKRETKANLFDTCLRLMDLYAATGQTDSLDRYKKETARLVDEIGNPALMVRFYECMARIYTSRGETGKAYDMVKKLITLKDSVYKAENLARMEQAHNIYEIEKKAIEKEYAIEKWDPVVVFFTMGSVVMAMAGLLVWIVVMRHKAERARKEKDEANASLARLREVRLNEEREQKEKAERDLNEQQRRLTAVTLEKIKTSQQIDEALTEVKQALLKIPPRDRVTQQKLKNAILKLETLDNESNWEEFQHYFTMVHPEFYRRIDEMHPELTPKERKLCALISLGLSTKDIASLTLREIRSVESSRNRLRKKLGLSTEVNLEDYMHRFAIGTAPSDEKATSSD